MCKHKAAGFILFRTWLACESAVRRSIPLHCISLSGVRPMKEDKKAAAYVQEQGRRFYPLSHMAGV